MEHVIQLHIEKLPEGMYLATSDEVQGLVAQGRTIQETIEIARDVAKKLIEAQTGAGANSYWHLRVTSSIDMPEGTLRAILKQAGIDVETFLQTN